MNNKLTQIHITKHQRFSMHPVSTSDCRVYQSIGNP